MATRLSGQSNVDSLFRENEADLRNYVGGKLGDRGSADVDDIVQEAFLRIATHDQPRKIENPRGFLFRVARNLTFDILRRGNVRKAYSVTRRAELISDQSMCAAKSVENVVSAEEDLALILAAIDLLPNQCRNVFLLQRMEGLPYAEVASRLEISESMVQKHMSKALSRLYEVLPDDSQTSIGHE